MNTSNRSPLSGQWRGIEFRQKGDLRKSFHDLSESLVLEHWCLWNPHRQKFQQPWILDGAILSLATVSNESPSRGYESRLLESCWTCGCSSDRGLFSRCCETNRPYWELRNGEPVRSSPSLEKFGSILSTAGGRRTLSRAALLPWKVFLFLNTKISAQRWHRFSASTAYPPRLLFRPDFFVRNLFVGVTHLRILTRPGRGKQSRSSRRERPWESQGKQYARKLRISIALVSPRFRKFLGFRSLQLTFNRQQTG